MSIRLASSIAMVTALAFGTAVGANAQTAMRCSPRAELLKQLSSQYREAPVAMGVASNGRLLEVLASVDGATWTALVTGTNGLSCVVMSGENWQSTPLQTLVRQPI